MMHLLNVCIITIVLFGISHVSVYSMHDDTFDYESYERKKPVIRTFWGAFFAARDARNPEEFEEYCKIMKSKKRAFAHISSAELDWEEAGPLHLAVWTDHVPLIDFLITNNIVSINDRNKNGKTALFFVKGIDGTKALLRHKIDVNRTLHGYPGCIKADECVSEELANMIQQDRLYKEEDRSDCCPICFRLWHVW